MLLFEDTRPGNPFVPPALMRCELGALFFLECPFSSSSSADWRRIVALIFLSSSPSPFLDVAASPFGVFRDDRAESDWNHVDVIYYYYTIIISSKAPSASSSVVRRPPPPKFFFKEMRDFSKKHKRIFKRGTTNGVDDVALISRLYHRGSGYSGGGGGNGGPFFFQRDERSRAGAFCFCVGQISSLFSYY